MNPKMFALLLLIPVAVFATDKLTSPAADGGGKEKRKTEATETVAQTEEVILSSEAKQVAVQSETQNVVAGSEEQSAQTASEPVQQSVSSKVSDEKSAAIASIRKLIAENRDAEEYDAHDYSQRMYIYDDEENDDLKNWLFKEVKTRLEDSNPMSLNLAEQFSRCPSGYHVFVVTKDEQPTNEGWIAEDSGCWDRPVTKFRYDFAAKTVEADAGELGYLPIDKFLRLLKAAKV